MIRFTVILFFFFHLAILLRAPRFAWLGRITGWGACGLFFAFYLFQIEENSDLVFAVMAVLTGLCMIIAELLAAIFRRRTTP